MNITDMILSPNSLFPKIDNPDYRSWRRGRDIFLYNRNLEAGSEILVRVTPGWHMEDPVEILAFSTVAQDGTRETRVYRLAEPDTDKGRLLVNRLFILWSLVYHAAPFEEQYSPYRVVESWGPFLGLPANCLRSIRIPDRQDRWDEYRMPVGSTADQGLRHLAEMAGFTVKETTLELDVSDDTWYDDYQVVPNHVLTNPKNGRHVTTLWGSDNPMSDHEFVGYTRDGHKTYIGSEDSRPILASIHSWLLGC